MKMQKSTHSIKLLGFLFLIALAAARGGPYGQKYNGSATQASTVATADGSSISGQPDLQQRNQRYRIQPDDGLVISFPLSPEFDQPTGCTTTVNCSVTVQPDGFISLKGAGGVYVEGMTLPEVVEALKKAYAGVLHDPIIHVDLVDFQRPFFLVSGQVGKPGQYDLRHDTTVSEAIAIAGGFASTAKTQVFLYHRVSKDWVEVKKLSLKDLLNGKNANEDAQLSSGDMIFVPEKFIANFRKYVPYSLSGAAAAYGNP
jgi:polysaccharide export outer membrane protein